MRNGLDKICRENQNTHFMFNNFFPKIVPFLISYNVEKYGRARQATDDNIIRRVRFACWVTKPTDTHSEYIILIAFPLEQGLRERAAVLRLYIHCLSFFNVESNFVVVKVDTDALSLVTRS
jgi:hypothetical protein